MFVSVHPVNAFRRVLSGFVDYPPGVVPGTGTRGWYGVFAGGPGLVCGAAPSAVGLPEFPYGKTMVIGHNLDAEGLYRRRLHNGLAHGDPRNPMKTWRGLYRLFHVARIDPHDCFFTNVYVGLSAGDTPMGAFPGASSPAFGEWCATFLGLQIQTMRPTVIATIGGDARLFAGRMSSDLSVWRSAPSRR